MAFYWYKCKINVLTKGVQHLLENELFYDCTLAAEGQYLNAHKLVLSACSPYFQVLFSQQNDKFPIIFLKDVKFRDVKSLIDLMYYGKTVITDDQKDEFLSTIKSLQMKGLKEFNNVESCESNTQIDVSGHKDRSTDKSSKIKETIECNGENIIDTNGETQIVQKDGKNDKNGNLKIENGENHESLISSESLQMADDQKHKYHNKNKSQKPGLTECNVEDTSNIDENAQISEDQQKLKISSQSLPETGLTECNNEQVNKEFPEVQIVQFGKSCPSPELVTVDSDDENLAVSAGKSQNCSDIQSKSCKNIPNESESLLPSKNTNISIQKSPIRHQRLGDISNKTKASSTCSSSTSSATVNECFTSSIDDKREYFSQENPRDSSLTLSQVPKMLVTTNCELEKDFICRYCDKKFQDEIILLKHEKSHIMFYCTDCDGRFYFQGQLVKHYNTYHKKCLKCMLVFKSQSELEEHKRSAHSDSTKKFICPWCDKKYTTKSYFYKHIEKDHNKGHRNKNSGKYRQLPYTHDKTSVDNYTKKLRKS